MILGDDVHRSRYGFFHTRRELCHEVARVGVDDGMRRIQPQAVDVVLVHPVQGVLDEELAHHRALRPIEVQPLAPRVRMDVREVVRTEH